MIPTRSLTCCIVLMAVPVLGAEPEPLRFAFDVQDIVVEFGADRPLFELHSAFAKGDPDDKALGPGDFQQVDRSEQNGQLVLRWTRPPSPWASRLRVTATLSRHGEQVLAHLQIENPGPWPVRRVRFPILTVRPTYPYDTLLLSHPMGDAMYYPNRVIGARMGGEAIYRYPATLAMQYMVLYNAGRSYYLSAYSTGDETFEHSAKTIRGGLRLSCVWYPFLETGSWQSPPCGFAVLPGGWHKAADLYRSRMAKVFQPPPLPAWMRTSFHGWGQVSMKGGSQNPPFRFRDIPSLYKKVADLGLNTLHIFSWGKGGMDNDYPRRTPSPRLGTPGELRDALDAVRAMGGHVVLYTNGRLIEPGTGFYQKEGGQACLALSEKGRPYEETYTRRFYVACPSAKAYRDVLFDNFRRMVLDYHAGGAQIDQIACTPAAFCFATEAHGHATPATNWLAPTDALLKRIHEFYRRHDPDFFVWAEGTNERFGRYYEVHQSHGEEGTWTPGDSLPEQYHYTYPNHLVTGTADSIPQMCHTFGQGKPFDFHMLRRLRDPDWVWLLKRLVAVRKAEPAYFLRGRFLDTVGLEVSGRDVRFWRIDRTDAPGTLVNLWARGRGLKDRARATVKLPEPDWPVRAVYPEKLSITKDGTRLVLEWTGPVATLVAEPLPQTCR